MKYFILVIGFLLLTSCSNTIVPNQSKESTLNMVTLSDGDVTQFSFHSDSTTVTISIVGKTSRIDGQVVFVEEFKIGNGISDPSYVFIKNGYFVRTALDTVKSGNNGKVLLPENPFYEEKYAIINPKNVSQWELLDPEHLTG